MTRNAPPSGTCAGKVLTGMPSIVPVAALGLCGGHRLNPIPPRSSRSALCVAQRNSVMLKYNPVDDLSPAEQHERCSRARSDFTDFGNAEQFFWFIQSDGKVVGNITLRNINRRMLTAEIGYNIAPEARGNGYATEAVRL